MNANDQYFSWADCWVITGILWATPNEADIDLAAIVGAGDMLNHSIYSEKELKDGFMKAQKKGLISIQGNKIILLAKGQEIKTKVQNMRGGLFSIVNNMQKKLNSRRTKLFDQLDEDINPCIFINEKTVGESYRKYSSFSKKINNKSLHGV
jgi:hypothetical protein